MKRSHRHVSPTAARPKSGNAGFTLIELMIALVLGLVVIAAAIAVFLSNKQAYVTNDALSEIQDNSRVAFELMARDIRQAGLIPCGDNGRIANVLSDGPNAGGSVDWFANFSNAVYGYDDATTDPALQSLTTNTPVAGSNSIELIGAGDVNVTLGPQPNGNNPANLTLSAATTQLNDGDIILICSPDHATIAQVTSLQSANTVLVHDTGNGVAIPGNCSKGLGYPTVCSTNGNTDPAFPPNSQISRLAANDWYLCNNAQGGTSLCRISLQSSGGNAGTVAQEMVRNVTRLQFTYHVNGAANYVTAGTLTATDWPKVDGVLMNLTLASTSKRAGTDAKPLTRTLSAAVAIRNRVK